MRDGVRAAVCGPEPSLSLEFFPPRTSRGAEDLWRALRALEPLRPDFVSVTCGAGGSTRAGTLDVVRRVRAETTLTPVMHLTCVGVDRATLLDEARRVRAAGATAVLALRGDPPDDPGGPWHPAPGDIGYAADLVRLLRGVGDFTIGVAAFPEGHPESPDLETDARRLAAKCAAGADFAITQFFFDAAQYRDMVARLRSLGCDTPVIPGVLPVTNPAQTRRFAAKVGVAIPPEIDERFRSVEHDAAAVYDVGVRVATELARDLLAFGVPGLHFYTLNQAAATRDVCAALHADGTWRHP